MITQREDVNAPNTEITSRPPTINNISFIGRDREWHTRTFFPFYDLKFADDVYCGRCDFCDRPHPMVQDDFDEYCYHKLCTLTVIKAKLINEKDLLK